MVNDRVATGTGFTGWGSATIDAQVLPKSRNASIGQLGTPASPITVAQAHTQPHRAGGDGTVASTSACRRGSNRKLADRHRRQRRNATTRRRARRHTPRHRSRHRRRPGVDGTTVNLAHVTSGWHVTRWGTLAGSRPASSSARFLRVTLAQTHGQDTHRETVEPPPDATSGDHVPLHEEMPRRRTPHRSHAVAALAFAGAVLPLAHPVRGLGAATLKAQGMPAIWLRNRPPPPGSSLTLR